MEALREEADLAQMTAEGASEMGDIAQVAASKVEAYALRAFADKLEKGDGTPNR